MRYMYAYKTSDGVRHEEEMSAGSREEVFEALRARGIRAIKVVARDGSRANGDPLRVRKRWLFLAGTAGAVAAMVLILALLWIGGGGDGADSGGDARGGRADAAARSGARVAKARTRRQIGLAEIVRDTPLEMVFSHPSEVLLARFAEPGQVVEVGRIDDPELSEDFWDALDDQIFILPGDSPGVAELKRIVAGLKNESKMMVASGKSFEEAIAYFVAQQAMEARYREMIISGDGSVEDKNGMLSALGLRTIPNPGE